jgi:membrane protein
LLQTLADLKLTGRLDEEGAQRHLLLADPRTPATPLIDALLLEDALRTHSFRRRAQFETLTLADLIGE